MGGSNKQTRNHIAVLPRTPEAGAKEEHACALPYSPLLCVDPAAPHAEDGGAQAAPVQDVGSPQAQMDGAGPQQGQWQLKCPGVPRRERQLAVLYWCTFEPNDHAMRYVYYKLGYDQGCTAVLDRL